jgi:hypothetical protein
MSLQYFASLNMKAPPPANRAALGSYRIACAHYLLLTDEVFVPLLCHNFWLEGITNGLKQMP